MRRSPRIPHQYLVSGALAVLVLSVYWQTGTHAFINVDDSEYVTTNPQVLQGLTLDGVTWAFTTFHFANWHPLTWLSHMADVTLFGLDAGWHHRMNVLFHLLNTELLFLVLWRMTGGMWPSAFVAALFGAHPLHVESVAWVAERKDVLSTLFWILTMGAYLRYVRRPGAGRYLLVAVSFALGLMCKPMLVTLPFVLLLLDWWPLGRFGSTPDPSGSPARLLSRLPRLAWEKAPLLALSAASCIVTYLAQAKGQAVVSLEYLPFSVRVANAFISYTAYLGKTAWPASLSVFYPHPAGVAAGIPAWQLAGSILLLAAATFLALRQGRRRPYLAVGWLWYLGTLVPALGLVQVGSHAIADRYTYVPLIGVFIALAWGISEALAGWRFRPIALGALGGAVVLALSAAGWRQAGYWRDDVTLFSHALASTDESWFVLNNLGAAYGRLGQYQQAVGCYREAVRILPVYAHTWNNLGAAYDKLGLPQEAVGCYREAVRIKPDYALAWNNLGVSYVTLGQYRLGIDCWREALRIKPDYAEAWNNLAAVSAGLGQPR